MKEFVSSAFSPYAAYRITKRLHQHWREEAFSYANTPRPDHGLLLVVSGKIRFVSAEEEWTAVAGDLVLLPAGSRYEAFFGWAEDYLINFEVSLPSLPADGPVRIKNACEKDVVEAFRRTVLHAFRPLAVQGQFFLLLDAVFSDGEVKPGHGQKMEQARTLLLDRDERSVREVASLCGISESGLRARFTKAYGLSPQVYRITKKMERAKFLLETTELSIREIAEELHFYDEAYFCKLFRKYVGTTPRNYLSQRTL